MNKILTMTPADLEKISEDFDRAVDNDLYALQQAYRLVDIAQMLGCKKTQAGEYINAHALPRKRLAAMILASAKSETLQFLVKLKGQVLVDKPKGDPIANVGTVCKEIGDAMQTLAEVLEDRKVTREELDRARDKKDRMNAAYDAALLDACCLDGDKR